MDALDEQLEGIVSVEPTRFLEIEFAVNGIQETLGGDLWQAMHLVSESS